ncbi:hypothetical protein ATE80_08690 [Streptomyces kanasensis]|uniref:Uncharacterized protein n=1 Tax=Streptomyces kanasensis TaxID=936756 RepID=A0A124ECZ7_9ACTN|nr:hypothetical protein ATE80_08690 [Streptomyces kanasensis]
MRFVGPDEAGGALQAHVHAEPGGQDVVEALPPAGPVGLLRQLHEAGRLVAVDAVRLEEQLHVRDLQRDLGRLHAADGGRGDVQDPGGLLPLQTRSLPQILESLAENDLSHGGGGPRLAHF